MQLTVREKWSNYGFASRTFRLELWSVQPVALQQDTFRTCILKIQKQNALRGPGSLDGYGYCHWLCLGILQNAHEGYRNQSYSLNNIHLPSRSLGSPRSQCQMPSDFEHMQEWGSEVSEEAFQRNSIVFKIQCFSLLLAKRI